MRLESQRELLLPGPPDEVWSLIVDPAHLSLLAAEIESSWVVRGGQVRVVARLGRRRHGWRAQPALDEARRELRLDSVTPGVGFHLEASVEPVPEGTRVRVRYFLEPPKIWKADQQLAGVPHRAMQRLLLSMMLFALTSFGVVELPSLGLSGPLERVAYALVGVAFVMAAALLSGAHAIRAVGQGGRRRFLARMPGLTRDGEAPKRGG